MRILAILTFGLLSFTGSAHFRYGDRVLARWTNNMYYRGHVEPIFHTMETEVLFTDGTRITHLDEDKTAIIADESPAKVDVRQHVLVTWTRWKDKYFIGFVIDKTSSRYKVLLDDGDQAWYKLQDLRVLPVADRFQLGARVFAYWPNGYYYRGFVIRVRDSEVYVRYDDGDSRTFHKNDREPHVVLDEIPQKQYHVGDRVLAATPDRKDRYASGRITSVKNSDDPRPWAEHAYYVDVNGGKYWRQFYQIRQMP